MGDRLEHEGGIDLVVGQRFEEILYQNPDDRDLREPGPESRFLDAKPGGKEEARPERSRADMEDMLTSANLEVLPFGRKDTSFGDVHSLDLHPIDILILDEAFDFGVEVIRRLLHALDPVIPVRDDDGWNDVTHGNPLPWC